MDSETSISKREKPIVGRYCVFRFFSRRQPVSDEVLKKLKESEDSGKFLGLYWLESDFEREKTVGNITKKIRKQMEKSREVEHVCQCLSGNLE